MYSKKRYLLIKIALPLLLIVTVSHAVVGFQKFEQDFSLLKLIKTYVERDFVNKDVDPTEMEYGAIRGLLNSLDDPYTRFVEPKSFEEMKVRMKGEFFGVGINIGMRDNILTVISPIAGTPADKAGLQAMDKILKIDGKSTDGISLMEAVNQIRGEKDSEVVLGIGREGEKEIRDISIIRGRIEIKAVDKVEVLREDVGYIRLNTFESRYAFKEAKDAVNKLKEDNIKGLVFDLRNNGGGLLSNAIQIAGIFMNNQDVVHTVNRDGEKNTEKTGRDAIYSGPLVLLINQGSASASEILAGAVKDNNRGELVGMTTFGKASVQRVINLPDRSAVLITIAKYLTPMGTDITKHGVTVNIEAKIPSADIQAIQADPEWTYSFDKDYQLQRAIDHAIKLGK